MNDIFKKKGQAGFIVAAAIVCVISLVLIVVWANEGQSGPLHAAQQKTTALLTPISSTTNGVATSAGDAAVKQANDNASEETLSSLKEQNAQLTSQVAKGEEYRQEALRLQELLNLKDSYDIDGVSAHVIGRTTDNWNQTVTIDVGENDGSFVGATVCSSFGVVGQVTSLTASTSVVRLLSDPQSGVAAMIQSTRTNCVVNGSLDGLVSAQNIAAGVNVSEGDIVITSGLGGSFTKGIIIGTVSKVSGNATDGTLKATIKQADNTNFEEVIVVKSAAD